jgi:hypothetical protein
MALSRSAMPPFLHFRSDLTEALDRKRRLQFGMPCREFTEGIFEESRLLLEALIQKPATIPLGERFSHAQVAGPHCSSSSPA